MKTVTIDGSQGAGKTSLCHLLARFFPDSIAIPLDPTGYDQEKDSERCDFLSIYANVVNDTRKYFENGKCKIEYISDTMFLLYTARLRMIESYKPFQDYDYIFVDSWYDPCWRFDEEMVRRTFTSLKSLVKMPDVSFFLSWEARKAYLRRCGASGTSEIYSEEEYKDIDNKRRYFLKFAAKQKLNMHKLQASKLQADILVEAISIITEKS